MSEKKLTVWYEKGLRFGCTQCGRCCSKEPGYVWLTEDDIDRIVTHLKISRDVFFQKYTRFVHGRYSLRELPITYDCIFLKDKKCSIYEARPQQCKKFPFWPENLASLEAWEETKTSCEGIDHENAPLIPLEEIEKRASE